MADIKVYLLALHNRIILIAEFHVYLEITGSYGFGMSYESEFHLSCVLINRLFSQIIHYLSQLSPWHILCS